MDKFTEFIEEKVMPVAGKLAEQRHLKAVKDGLILSLPLIIIGSVFLIISYIPVPGYDEFMAKIFGDMWRTKLLYPVGVTFDLMAVFVSFGVAYHLANAYEVDALSAGAISLASFLLVTPYRVMFTPPGMEQTFAVSAIPKNLMGSEGMFVAMIIALISTEIYRIVIQRNIVIKMPEGVPPAVLKSFTALIPGAFVITVIWILRLGIEQTSFESVHVIISTLFYNPLSKLGASLGGALIAVFVVQLLWSMGVHGMNIVASVMYPIWYSLMDQNRMVFQADPTAPLPHVTTYQFFMNWVFIGGAGATLALACLFVFKAKSKQTKSLGKLSLGSSIFNINEPIIFGAPIVLNPILIIPFILAPMVTTVVSYLAMNIGLVAKPCGIAVPWTTPFLISGYLATGGKISGVVLQFVNFIVALGIYYPFFRIWDKRRFDEEKGMMESAK